MTLTSYLPELHRAQAGGYAVPLFLTPEMLAAEGTTAALCDCRAPGALGLYAHLIESPRARIFSGLLRAFAEEAPGPVALVLDHGASLEQCALALRYGLTDVMYDGSRLPLEENIRTTREIVRMAHAVGASVEAELGHVGSGAEYDTYGARGAGFTDPAVVERFVAETGTDILAVAFGSAHGVYKGEPRLDLELLAEIRACCPVPLSMHGGSGLSEAQFQGAIAAGISKINVFTDLALTAGARMVAHAQTEKPSYFSMLEVVRAAFRERCAYYLDVFGASGRAAPAAGPA